MVKKKMQYGDLGKRFFAYIIDGFVLFFIYLIVFGIAASLNIGIAIALIVIAPLISLFYYVLLEGGSWHATLGKRAMRLYVADENGVGISHTVAVLRFISKILSGLFFGVGYFIALFSENKQCLHDMIARTYVLDGISVERGKGSLESNGVPELICVKGPLAGMIYNVTSQGLLIGRDSVSCQVVIPSSHKNISRIHCYVTYNPMSGMFVLNDRKSSFGTYLENGSRVDYSRPAALRSGEKFYISSPDVMFQVN